MNKNRGVIGTLTVDNIKINILEGDTIGGCLIRAGFMTFHYSNSGEPRGLFCGSGVCNECRVTVDGIYNVRACVAKAKPGSRIQISNNPLL